MNIYLKNVNIFDFKYFKLKINNFKNSNLFKADLKFSFILRHKTNSNQTKIEKETNQIQLSNSEMEFNSDIIKL